MPKPNDWQKYGFSATNWQLPLPIRRGEPIQVERDFDSKICKLHSTLFSLTPSPLREGETAHDAFWKKRGTGKWDPGFSLSRFGALQKGKGREKHFGRSIKYMYRYVFLT